MLWIVDALSGKSLQKRVRLLRCQQSWTFDQVSESDLYLSVTENRISQRKTTLCGEILRAPPTIRALIC